MHTYGRKDVHRSTHGGSLLFRCTCNVVCTTARRAHPVHSILTKRRAHMRAHPENLLLVVVSSLSAPAPAMPAQARSHARMRENRWPELLGVSRDYFFRARTRLGIAAQTKSEPFPCRFVFLP